MNDATPRAKGSPILEAAQRVDATAAEILSARNEIFLEGVAQNAINHVMRLKEQGEVDENHVVAKRSIHRILLELLRNTSQMPIARTAPPEKAPLSQRLSSISAAIESLNAEDLSNGQA